MRSVAAVRGHVPGWEITVPSRPGGLPGVVMAGFSDRANEFRDLALVPHPAVTLLFDLGDEPFTIEDDRGSRQLGRVVAGLAPRQVRGSGLTRRMECLQVRLSPMAAHAVLGASAELSGTVVALDDLWGREAERVQERLRAARSWEDRFAIARDALARRADQGRAADPEVAFSWRRMAASGGRVPVERLAAEAGWSRKRLWARFRAQVGLTPKRVARLIRFDQAAHRLAAGERAALVAAESGYADQSHLHRDVMTFAGVTPAGVALSPFLAVDDVAWPSGPPRDPA
ncbi:helix-turn-helix domain-containing protein [Nonomuraea sp. NPDC001023]|uniref:helix-turn-helix domain-containing protein n=1 Tax=unclassified Nonomuraea TaxID=2593643 RepID=UPI0033247F86